MLTKSITLKQAKVEKFLAKMSNNLLTDLFKTRPKLGLYSKAFLNYNHLSLNRAF